MFNRKFQSPLKNYLIEVEAGLAEPPPNLVNLASDYAKAISSNRKERCNCINNGVDPAVLNWLVLDPDRHVRWTAIFYGGLPPIGRQEDWPNWSNRHLRALFFYEMYYQEGLFQGKTVYRRTPIGRDHLAAIKTRLIDHTIKTQGHLRIVVELIKRHQLNEEQSLTLSTMGEKKINILLARNTPYVAVLEQLQHSTEGETAELATNRLLSQRLAVLNTKSNPLLIK